MVKEQVETGLEIRGLIVKKKIVSQEKLNDYLSTQNNSRLPLGQILIEMGKLSVDQCQQSLEEFVAEENGISIVDGEVDLDSISLEDLSHDLEAEASATVPLDESEEAKKELEASVGSSERENQAPADEELPTFAFEELESMVLHEYLEVLDEVKKDDLDQSV